MIQMSTKRKNANESKYYPAGIPTEADKEFLPYHFWERLNVKIDCILAIDDTEYDHKTNIVHIEKEKLLSKTLLFCALQHEYGHAFFHNKFMDINNEAEIVQEKLKSILALVAVEIEQLPQKHRPYFYDWKHFHIIKEEMADLLNISIEEAANQLITVTDTMTIANQRYGMGHEFGYFQDEEHKMHELFAYGNQIYWGGNAVFHTMLPHCHKAIMKLFDDIFTAI